MIPSWLGWLEDLETLLARFSCLGIGPDIPGMSFDERWGVYRNLAARRLAGD